MNISYFCFFPSKNYVKKVQIPILLPKMGESVSEAIIVEWLKKPGDFIERDELFVLIATDKVESELPAEFEGKLIEILVPEKAEVEVGGAICIMEVDEKDVQHLTLHSDSTDTENRSVKEEVEVSKAKSFKGSKTFLSPVVRKIATEAGLELSDLERIQGSGENARIQKKDILNYLNPNKSTSEAKDVQFQKMKLNLVEGDTLTELSRMQKLLANHLQQSFMEIPHVTTFAEIDVTEIVEHREEIKSLFQEQHSTKVTLTHYFQYAIIQALKEFPLLNSWMNVDELILKKDINLGFAASLDDGGLIVPNVKSAQNLDFISWIKSVNEMALNAKSGKLKNDDIQNTTFTVSNTGMFGSLAGTPIISKPQVGILALGQILSAAGVIEINGVEELAIRKKMMLSISYDHRVINGAYASQFLTKVKDELVNYENWK